MYNLKEHKRIEFIDFYRGIGIILMIMGHIGYGEIFGKFIHAFHMPMFFIISGYFFKNVNTYKPLEFKLFIKKKAKQLIIPYVFFGIIHLVIYAIINYENKNSILNRLYSFLFINTDGLPIAGALWFLTSLFFAEIIYYFISTIKNKKLKLYTVLSISTLGIIIPFFIRLPYGIDVSFVAIGLMYIGELIKEHKDKILNMNLKCTTLIGIIETALIFLNGYINLRMGKYSIVPLFYFNATISSILLLNLSKIICNLNIKYSILKKIKELILNIGLHSITYLILNQITILIITSFCRNINIPIVAIKLICLPTTIALIYVLNLLLSTKYLKFLIGK